MNGKRVNFNKSAKKFSKNSKREHPKNKIKYGLGKRGGRRF